MKKKNKRLMRLVEGSCPICGRQYSSVNIRTRHHVLPKRFFNGRGEIYVLCVYCHRKLEKKIPVIKQLPPDEYRKILQDFIDNNKRSQK